MRLRALFRNDLMTGSCWQQGVGVAVMESSTGSSSRSAAELLGRELFRLRQERGLSLRQMARALGMTAHSGLVDYERGYRIPPNGLMASYARALNPKDGRLLTLHRAALAERAQRRIAHVTPELDNPAGSHAEMMHTLAEGLENLARLLRYVAAAWPSSMEVLTHAATVPPQRA